MELSSRDVNDRLLTVEACISDQPLQVSPPLLAVVLPTDGQAEVGVVGHQSSHLSGRPSSVTPSPNQQSVAPRAGYHVVDVRYHLQGVPIDDV